MSDTPNTHTVRVAWTRSHPFPLTTDTAEREAEFDRWLAAELAAAWAEGHDAGWDERNEFVNHGAIPSGIHQSEAVNPYLADRIEEDQ